MPIKNRLSEMHAEITGWRRHLHQMPELLYEVHKTAAFVEEKLRSFGISDITTGVGRTGVVAVIEGRTNTSGRVIGLRADMDALPITEATGLDYASQTPGLMHACGHDGHTSILLGTAKYLAETRNFDGRAVLIFQPAEEGGAGGKAMCDDGMMERWGIEEVYGLHNAPGIPVGEFAIRSGPLLASSDEFEILVTGVGGHAATPHEAIDTTLVASQIVVSLQSIVSRNIDPLKRVVLTVGTFETDSTASNVIAHTARLQGTVRTLDTECRSQAETRVRRIAQDIASAYGAQAEVTWTPGYPVTVNTEAETGYAVEAARAVAAKVSDNTDPIMPSEDFAYMLEERPGAYIFLGNGDTAMCHHPAYDFDDEAIPLGCSWFAELVERRMPAA
ncbi:M20 aminoacylase family protein [Phaeobacter gallaeciensis]|uniref:Amidohydrolase n=1 Tax=Phaeobacter gallaeciensis TaxID=60890 RepID=A0AAD0EDJ3_9RHOB|nr:M20 aminoacylase family protein [Phaeobacter gallaeciensis]AHD10222.1 amidohydrolase [Phaeobacter gallaeciensis DSM 26640]ATE93486.1 amidohydrolase [Phaeobacter gallaeciensis]ATE96693.1 amidohydrolase [Phaeobacter gallaeciensis]ATF02150.1 amidohydrolase [Phaeobacter gallaeciensis]ATF06530.1 amidohydrolase [Phaeobacter gallaeciensis]